MLVSTSRFGMVEVDDQRVITFPKGLLGFSRFKHYVLIQPASDSAFYWLQSLDTPDLAFVVTEPGLWVSSYRVPLKDEQLAEMGLEKAEDAQVLVIVNKHGQNLTGNLQGPLVINVHSREGEQLVLSDRRFTTRVPLVELASPVEALSA